MKISQSFKHSSAALLLCLALSACTSFASSTELTPTPHPTPSIAPIFGDAPTRIATPTALSIPTATATLVLEPTATASANIQPTRLPDKIEVISIFDEKLNPNWSLDTSQNVRYDIANTSFAEKGKVAILVQPAKGFGRLFFSVKKDSRDIYGTDRVLGVRFWVSGGDHIIATSDLAVTVTGSNQYTYWVANDTSVKINTAVTPDAPLFSETRLYDLGVNRSIPAKSWVEVIVWLDKLLYDPQYRYVTGVYIKNDELFTDTYYLDRVDLLLQAKT
ncbi:MAG TPA: hypothetical protein PKK15_00045 [Kouleothrix sp.]|uniref:hypothetical protein n=1 Tax=Kouleothrix sp. TaxID=2779161 RepID=UPI002C63870F|nr:hypothetical protein [Kouleothrix sp.]